MKRKLLCVLLTACMTLFGIIGFTACDDEPTPTPTPTPTPATPEKLATPIVALADNVATWAADTNADKFELSVDGNLSYVENTVTSKTLSDGQTLKVRAVGDGVNYQTSDWSNSVTYTDTTPDNPETPSNPETPDNPENPSNPETPDNPNNPDTPATTEEPTYLGIFASSGEPSVSDGLPDAFATVPARASYRMALLSEYRSFDDVLKEYFESGDHDFGANYPTESAYDIYSRAGETVYIQIWLNNPSQHTILSLKLNGTKYQVGGGLSSFFIEDGGEWYNCVYVAVTIANGTYENCEYTVSDIEYIADTYINADGTDEFMNNNDTITVGLPYAANNPTVSEFEIQSLTVKECSATFTLSDTDGVATASGGWLGVAIYDYENFELIDTQAAVIGNNTFSATGLEENSYYELIVYVYGDLHDGRGVCAHSVGNYWIETPEVLTVNEIESTNVLNEQATGYVGAITVDTTLASDTAEYVKLEIIDGEETVVYTDENFDGYAVVSQGIFNKAGYTVKVYYKDTAYPQGKSVERYVYVGELSQPSLSDEDYYAFVNDGIYWFKLDGYDENYAAVDSFIVRFYDHESAQYIAEDVLYLMDNPTAIDDIQEQINALYGTENSVQEYQRLSNRRNELYHAKSVWEELFENNEDRAFWETEKAKGKYYYEYTYAGADTENVKKTNGFYYVILPNVNGNGCERYKMDVVAQVVKNESAELVETVYNQSDIRFKTLFAESHYANRGIGVKDYALDGNEFTFTLYNTDDPRAGDSDDRETNENKRFIYKIEINGTTVYLNETATAPTVDEEAWIAEYLENVQNGDLDAFALYKKYVPDYTAGSITLDFSQISAGQYNFMIYTRMYNKVYEAGESDDWTELWEMEVYKQFDTPTIEIDGGYGYIQISEYADTGNIVFEAYDKNDQPIAIDYLWWSDEKQAYRFDFAYQGAKVRAKLSDGAGENDEGGETPSSYWYDSAWSVYQNSAAVELNAPTFTLESYYLSWVSDSQVEYISGYTFVVNDGDEQNGSGCSLYQYRQGCTVKVKAVASEAGKIAGYCDSDWATYTYVYSGGSADKEK